MADVNEIIHGRSLELPKEGKVVIEVIQGNDQGAKFVLSRKARIVFGRGGDVDVVLNDPMVASHHAAIEVYGEVIAVREVKSATGVFVNDIQIKDAVVSSGDRIRLGGTVMKIGKESK